MGSGRTELNRRRWAALGVWRTTRVRELLSQGVSLADARRLAHIESQDRWVAGDLFGVDATAPESQGNARPREGDR